MPEVLNAFNFGRPVPETALGRSLTNAEKLRQFAILDIPIKADISPLIHRKQWVFHPFGVTARVNLQPVGEIGEIVLRVLRLSIE